MKQIKGLDSLRAFAVTFVVLSHWGINQSKPAFVFSKQYLLPDGSTGVDIFFVLSGFLITSMLLFSKNEPVENNKLTIIKNFMVRRVLRIFPIYYLTILALITVNYSEIRDHAWYYLTYTSNILFFKQNAWGTMPHTWSLAVEEQFYLLWPWLILFINNKYLKYVFIITIIVGTAGGYYTSHELNRPCYPILIYNCLGCFGLGGFYAYARMDKERCRKFEKCLIPLFVICVSINISWTVFSHDTAFWRQTIDLFRTVHGVIALQIIVAIINNRSEWIRKYILENKVLNYIGKISYGIYLYHMLLTPFSDIVRVTLLLAICSFSYKLIELPFLNLKKYFKYNN